jgi:uncharacterized ferredoxin-like protein
MRGRGAERKQAIWFRDAAVGERIDGVLFIGLKNWYPPIYDCGACGYATCAEFMEATKALREESETLEFAGPQCNLRDIDLGIAVGSLVKTASMNNIDTRCQTRIAVAARKLKLIEADIAVALSMSLTHKNPGIDNAMPKVDFAAPEYTELPATGVSPIKTPGGGKDVTLRSDSIRYQDSRPHAVLAEPAHPALDDCENFP